MKLNINHLISLAILVSQTKAQLAQAATNVTQPANTGTAGTTGTLITDEQLNAFSYGKEEFRMAIIGDSGAEKESREVMKLTTYDSFIHLGDYDYECEPRKYFDTTLDSHRSYDFMGILGNHEGVSQCNKEKFETYKKLLYNEMSKNSRTNCQFSSSKAMWVCTYKNARIIGLSPGINGADDRGEQLAFLKKHLSSATEDWKICSWHFYDKYYHTGKYPEDSRENTVSRSYESFYDYCKSHGAIILSAHDHVYARTRVMSKFSSPVIDEYDGKTESNIVQIRKGATLNILNGAGGYEMYEEKGKEKDYSFWQKKYAKGSGGENAKKYGGLFCNFNVGGNPKKAHCQFLRINSSEKLFDDFYIYQNENPGTVTPAAMDEEFKNEKINAYKIANNIIDQPANATTATTLNTNTVTTNNSQDQNIIINQKEEPEDKGIFTAKNITIGGSVCAALAILGGIGFFIKKNKSKKYTTEDTNYPNYNFQNNNNTSNTNDFITKPWNDTFAPISTPTSATSNFGQKSFKNDYRHYEDDVEPLVDNRYRFKNTYDYNNENHNSILFNNYKTSQFSKYQ